METTKTKKYNQTSTLKAKTNTNPEVRESLCPETKTSGAKRKLAGSRIWGLSLVLHSSSMGEAGKWIDLLIASEAVSSFCLLLTGEAKIQKSNVRQVFKIVEPN